MSGAHENQNSVSPELLARLERVAVELATLAGAEITTSLGHALSVRYKTKADETATFGDPVSEVDHNTEVLIRARLSDMFPTHGVLGEEMEAKAGEDFIWAVDPVDGTTNFVNGFPLFAASVGVLHRGLSRSFGVHGSLGMAADFVPSEPEVARDPERDSRKAEASGQGRLQGPALRGDADPAGRLLVPALSLELP